LSEKDSFFFLYFGNLLRIRIQFYFYQNIEQKPILTYLIQKIEILGNTKLKEKTESLLVQKLVDLNIIIQNLIIIHLDKEENIKEDFMLNDLRIIIKYYINKNISKIIFISLTNSFREIIEKIIDIKYTIDMDKNRKAIKVNFDIPNKYSKMDFFIGLNLEEQNASVKSESLKISYMRTEKDMVISNSFSDKINNNNIFTKDSPHLFEEKLFENHIQINDMDIDVTNSLNNMDKNLNNIVDNINNVNLNGNTTNILTNDLDNKNKFLENFKNKESETDNNLIISFSHKILNRNPLLIIRNQKNKINLFELNSINLKKTIIEKIKEFREIIFEKIFTFIYKLKFEYLKLIVKRHETFSRNSNKKILIYFDKILLFSLCLNDNFELVIQDSYIYFEGKKNQKYIENSINQFLEDDSIGKFSTTNEDFRKFNKFIFSRLIENFFKFEEINAKIDFNISNINQFSIKICFVDQKINNSKCFIVLELEKICNNINKNNFINLQTIIPNNNSYIKYFNNYQIIDFYLLIDPMEFVYKSIYEDKNNINNISENNFLIEEIIDNENKESYVNSLSDLNKNIPNLNDPKNNCTNFLIKRHKFSLIKSIINYDKFDRYNLYVLFEKKMPFHLDYDFFCNLLNLHYYFKSNHFETFMSISEYIFYFQNFFISEDLEKFTFKVENNLNSLKNLCRNYNEFVLLKNLIHRISFSNKISGIELFMRPELEKFLSINKPIQDKTNSYIEGEYCQSFDCSKRIISFNFITKILHKCSDTNFIKKVFEKFISRLLIFFTRIKCLIESMKVL